MGFNQQEKALLLEVKGVGETVVQRFEQVGINNLAELSQYRAEDIAEMVAAMLHTTCWKNSPQAKLAISAAIQKAKEQTTGK